MTQVGELNRDESIDRRRFLRRAGAVAWSTPLIVTVLASRAGAQTCLPTSSACSTTSPPACCLPDICCPTGTPQAGFCKLPNGAPCNGNGNCCSGKCQGSPKQCVA
jgi:hypothetical protein